MRIRRAVASDAAALAALYRERRRWLLERGNRQWRDERFTAPELHAAIRRSPVLVATLGDHIIGAARLHWRDRKFWPDCVGSDAAYVAGLVVATRVAGRGISDRLIAAAAQLARARPRQRAGRPGIRAFRCPACSRTASYPQAPIDSERLLN